MENKSKIPPPFQNDFEKINQIESTDLFESWRVKNPETNEKYIMVHLNNQILEKFIEKINRARSLSFVTLIPIAFCDFEKSTIFYQDPGGVTINEYLKGSEKFDSLQKYLFTCGIAASISYFKEENVPIGPLTENDIFVVDGRPKIINYGFNQYFVSQEAAELLKKVCIPDNDDKNTQEISEKELFTNNFYQTIFDNLNSSSPPKVQEIIKFLFSANLSTLGIEDKSTAESYISQLMTSTLKSNIYININQRFENSTSILNEMQSHVSEMSNEIDKLKRVLMSIKDNKQETDEELKKTKSEIDMNFIKTLVSISKNKDNKCDSLYIPVTTNAGGIFFYLTNSKKSVFDHSIIPSQSSGDIYCIIDENDEGNFSSGSGDYEWIQFEFQEEIQINSFKIQSAHRSFLKSWSLIAFDSDDNEITLFETEDDERLKGKYAQLTEKCIKNVKTSRVRLEKYGENWNDSNFIRIKNIEFYCKNRKYSNGIFKKLISEAPGKDPHKSNVYITSSNFDFRFFHLLNPPRTICTLYDEEAPWFQVELTKGKVAVEGYRIKQLPHFPFYSWSFEASNNKKDWDVLDVNEIEEDQFAELMTFTCKSNRPYSVFRIYNRMVNENDDIKLRLQHFDVFGLYIPS